MLIQINQLIEKKKLILKKVFINHGGIRLINGDQEIA